MGEMAVDTGPSFDSTFANENGHYIYIGQKTQINLCKSITIYIINKHNRVFLRRILATS